MVGTLIRHENLRTRGWLTVVLGAAVLLTTFGVAMEYTPWQFVRVIGFLLTLLAVGALFTVVQVGLGLDYWRSSFGRTGYFTQSLPIKGATIHWAKFLWGFIVSMITLVLNVVLAVICLLGASRTFQWGITPQNLLEEIRIIAGQTVPLDYFWMIIIVLATVTISLVQYYFAAAIGSEARINKLGIGGPILVWFGLYVALQILLLLGLFFVPVGLAVSQFGYPEFVTTSFSATFLSEENPDIIPFGFVPVLVLTTVAMCWRTVVSWNRKVSLA